jgi:transcriptional regulator with XRE-family HTH domain
MAATPRRRGLKPRGSSVFVSDVLGKAVKVYRGYLNLSQQDLAERMTALVSGEDRNETKPQRWHAQTVSEVESGNRVVTLEELCALAAALRTSVGALLIPLIGEDPHPPEYDIGGPAPIPWIYMIGLVDRIRPDLMPYHDTFVWQGNTPVAIGVRQMTRDEWESESGKRLPEFGLPEWIDREEGEQS